MEQSNVAGRNKDKDPYRPVVDLRRGERLKMVRELLFKESNQAEFARWMAVSPGRYGNWEAAGKPVPEEFIKELVRRKPGLTTDWLLFEDKTRLSWEISAVLYPIPERNNRS